MLKLKSYLIFNSVLNDDFIVYEHFFFYYIDSIPHTILQTNNSINTTSMNTIDNFTFIQKSCQTALCAPFEKYC